MVLRMVTLVVVIGEWILDLDIFTPQWLPLKVTILNAIRTSEYV